MFTLTIETDGAAFEPEFSAPAYEVGRILHELADALTCHGYPDDIGTVRDANGNTVGAWSFSDDLGAEIARMIGDAGFSAGGNERRIGAAIVARLVGGAS